MISPLYVPKKSYKFIQDVRFPTISEAMSKREPKAPISKQSQLRINAAGKITRVPPMSELKLRQSSYKEEVQDVVKSMAVSAVSKLGVLAAWFKLKLLPKRYTLSKGLIIDWHTLTFQRAKFALPGLAALYVAMVMVLAYPLGTSFSNSGAVGYVHAQEEVVAPAAEITDTTGSSDSSSSSSVYGKPMVQPALPESGARNQSAAAPTTSTPMPVAETPLEPVPEVIPPAEQPLIEVPPVSIDAGNILNIETPRVELL